MKSKVKKSTEKAFIGEIRLINGKPMVWSSKGWITESEWDKQYYTTVNIKL